MAVDTQAKRNSAIATRRLPWFRRFAPQPDGTVGQADRQQVAFVYNGILAEDVAEIYPADTQFTRFGPGGSALTRTSAGAITASRTGPGGSTVTRKTS